MKKNGFAAGLITFAMILAYGCSQNPVKESHDRFPASVPPSGTPGSDSTDTGSRPGPLGNIGVIIDKCGKLSSNLVNARLLCDLESKATDDAAEKNRNYPTAENQAAVYKAMENGLKCTDAADSSCVQNFSR